MKKIVIIFIILITSLLTGCLSRGLYIRGGDLKDAPISILAQREDCRVVSKATWIERGCGLPFGYKGPFTNGVLMTADNQLSFFVWDGEEYEPLFEVSYDKINKVEVKRSKMLVVFLINNKCYTFWLIKERKMFIDVEKTNEMADFISKKVKQK